MWGYYYRRRLAESLQPHDLDTPEVEPVELPAPPATTGRVDDDAGDSERQARLEAWPGLPVTVDPECPPGMVYVGHFRESPSCRFPFAACDLSEGVVPRQVL